MESQTNRRMTQLKLVFPDKEKEAIYQRIVKRLQKNIDETRKINEVHMKQIPIKHLLK